MTRQIFIAYLMLFVISTYSCKTNSSTVISNTVRDVDGNVYDIVTIGKQRWLKQNLRASHYRDGSLISEIEDSSRWANIFNANSKLPAWCYYNGESENNLPYGKLYNWWAIADSRQLCPMGWHIFSDSELSQLSDYLGGDSISGEHLKADTLWWDHKHFSADNSSAFTGLPAGGRDPNGTYFNINYNGYFWTATQSNNTDAENCYLTYLYPYILYNKTNKSYGFSVRCIED